MPSQQQCLDKGVVLLLFVGDQIVVGALFCSFICSSEAALFIMIEFGSFVLGFR